MFFKRKPIIVTHSGRFHADDLFAVAMLLEYFNGHAKIIRTVDETEIMKADFVLDIGREYNPSKNRFDHHQGRVGARENGVSYATAGLIWKHFGEKIAGSPESAKMIDEGFVMQIDVVDTGEASPKPLVGDVYPYLFDNITGIFGNTWNEKGRSETESFMFLLPFARAILKREIIRANDKIEAREMVQKIYDTTVDKRILIMNISLPLEILEDKPEVLFIASPEPRSGGWSVRTMRRNKHEYGNRKDLPKAWAGKSGEEMAKVSGVSDAVFCHLKLFLAVAKSREGALMLAQLALNSSE